MIRTGGGREISIRAGGLLSQPDPELRVYSHKMQPEELEHGDVLITAHESKWPNDFAIREKDLGPHIERLKREGRYLNLHELGRLSDEELRERIREHIKKSDKA
jgi:hypothetical protein